MALDAMGHINSLALMLLGAARLDVALLRELLQVL